MCPLCLTTTIHSFVLDAPPKLYHHCKTCDLRYLDPKHHLNPTEERARYLTHNNDVNDHRYINFVTPLFNAITELAPRGATGLDFGAGTGPVLTKLLREADYEIDLYDPYFWPDPTPLSKRYDFIFACEVIEHLYDPRAELARLKNLLNKTVPGSGGFLAFMTHIYDSSISFSDWYYRRDPTHVAFYSRDTFVWIQKHLGFVGHEVTGPRTIVLTSTRILNRRSNP